MEDTFGPQIGVYVFKTIFNEPLKEKKNIKQDLEITVKIAPESSADQRMTIPFPSKLVKSQ